jgi:hypothetical protein
MAVIDIDGTTTGGTVTTGSLAVLAAMGGITIGSGSGASALPSQSLDQMLSETLTGGSTVSGIGQALIDVSGMAIGSGSSIDGSVVDVAGGVLGSTTLFGNARRIFNMRGYAYGRSITGDSTPYPIYGTAIVSGVLEITHIGYPICQTPLVKKSFRWGHSFAPGDLEVQVVGPGNNPVGPVCMQFTMFQVQQGCALMQKGLTRRPGKTGVGKFYATGTAGECGQPGLWVIRWSHQITTGGPTVEKDCYFYVLDSTVCSIPGDTLNRGCKYGWD